MISQYGSKGGGGKGIRFERNKHKNEDSKTMAPNSNDKTENTSDEAEKNEHNSKCMLRIATE